MNYKVENVSGLLLRLFATNGASKKNENDHRGLRIWHSRGEMFRSLAITIRTAKENVCHSKGMLLKEHDSLVANKQIYKTLLASSIESQLSDMGPCLAVCCATSI